MPKKPVRALRARKTFAVPGSRSFRRGDLIRSDDPVVEGREDLFEDVLNKLGVEQATANPGERRNAAKNVCDTCGFKAKTAAGLTTHERTHEEAD